jgi:hypothetical protein
LRSGDHGVISGRMGNHERSARRQAIRLGIEAGVITLGALVGLQLLYDGVYRLQAFTSATRDGPATITPGLGLLYLVIVLVFLVMASRHSAMAVRQRRERVYLGALTGALGGAAPGIAGFGALAVAAVLGAGPGTLLLLVPVLLLLAGGIFGGLIGGLTGACAPLIERGGALLVSRMRRPAQSGRSRR